jgi:hypothetical protein
MMTRVMMMTADALSNHRRNGAPDDVDDEAQLMELFDGPFSGDADVRWATTGGAGGRLTKWGRPGQAGYEFGGDEAGKESMHDPDAGQVDADYMGENDNDDVRYDNAQQHSNLFLTNMEYAKYRLQYRNKLGSNSVAFNALQRSGRLFHEYMVDPYVKIERQLMKRLKNNQKKVRAAVYKERSMLSLPRSL